MSKIWDPLSPPALPGVVWTKGDKGDKGDTGAAGTTPWSGITDKPATFAPTTHGHVKADVSDFPASLPASDVSAWAKEVTKPTYAASEIADISVAGQELINDADAAAQIATLGLDANIATLTLGANTTISNAGANLLNDSNYVAMLATLGITSTAAELNKLDSNTAALKLPALNTAPASATAAGSLGEIRFANGYIYLCVATNTWQRSALATW